MNEEQYKTEKEFLNSIGAGLSARKCEFNVLYFDQLVELLNEFKRHLIETVELVPGEKWIGVNYPPKESGRYWCYVEEQNDLGLSHFQWNCSYDPLDKTWSDNCINMIVTHWQPLPAAPGQSNVATPPKVSDEEIIDIFYKEIQTAPTP